MPVPKGMRVGGRQKGTPNKHTAEIKALARSYGPAAIKKLKEIADDEASPPQAKVAAIKELLDRGFGKSAQPLTGEEGEGPIQHAVEVTFVGIATKGGKG